MQSGTTLRNRYQIIKSLGKGGFGDTYLAQDNDLPEKPQCVVKHLRPKSSNPGILPIAQTLFEREANTLDKLGKYHQQIPQLLAHFQEEGEFYLVQEYIDGQDISKELIPSKKLSESYTVKLLKSILEVLAFVHQENVIHRDIKPQNLMRRRQDSKIVLIDFGAVKEISTLVINAAGETSITVAVGTPGYMPSEQAIGKPKFSSDIYAVGMIGIQALTGRKPHQLPEDNRTGNILWRDQAEVSEKLADIIDKMVRDHFSQRYQDAAEALAALMAANIEVENESVLEFPLITSTQTFTTVKVNEKGEIIDRRQQQAQIITENLPNGVILEMILIPGGRFLMGSPDTEVGQTVSEKPQHYVDVPEFFLGKYPVTQAQWEVVMGNNPSFFKGANLPVESVSWNDAIHFCQRLSEITGKIYRLPTEAEWEYACRARTSTPFYFGETITTELANYNGKTRLALEPKSQYRQETTDVGSFPPNAFGLYDMHGNVWEWCQDIWHGNYHGAPTDGSAWETGGSTNRRLLRGGSWLNSPWFCRSTLRYGLVLKSHQNKKHFGFRVATDSEVSHNSSSKSTKIILPSTSLSQPLPKTELISSTQTFTTVTVNAKGEIIDRRQQQAEVMEENLGNGVILEMVLIPGGRFLMGSPDTEAEGYDREKPQHYVNVPKFFMGKYPITQIQWETIMGNNPSSFRTTNRPVENVSWNNAIEFCQRLSQITAKNYRLPSEAEWEYACRAGTTTSFYFGETITTDLANYRGISTYASEPRGLERQETTSVGSFSPNAFGLYDMHGNVWEWCQDVWHDDYNGSPKDGGAWESGENRNIRLLRGGSWDDLLGYCRCSYRARNAVTVQYFSFGFRVATDADITRDSSDKSAKIILPSTSLSQPLPKTELISSTQTFTTVTVNAKGEIIDRRQQQAQIITENLPNSVILEMVLIPGGRFLMGSPDTEVGREDDESPQHYVDVAAFLMGKYPVTQAQWEAVMGNNPSYFRGANLPVEKVSWNDATEFCQRLSQMTGKKYRLPSEAEWEYACRARTSTPFYFGETITSELANYRGSSTCTSTIKQTYRKKTTDVGSFPPNAFGLYDMHGNVWEWCQDVWHYNYDSAPTDGSAWESGGADSNIRIMRGGSWLGRNPRLCRSANRDQDAHHFRNYVIGFRLVMG